MSGRRRGGHPGHGVGGARGEPYVRGHGGQGRGNSGWRGGHWNGIGHGGRGGHVFYSESKFSFDGPINLSIISQ